MPLDASIFGQARPVQISGTNALMQALQINNEQQKNALMGLQMQDVHDQRRLAIQQAQEAAQRRAGENALRQSLPDPRFAGAQGALAGGGGPTMANAARMPQVDPRAALQYQVMQAGGSVQDYINAIAPQNKIKDYKPIRNPDGSVSYVGLTEDGRVIQTGQQPFEKPEIKEFGNFMGGIDPITGKVTNYGAIGVSPNTTATQAGEDRRAALSRQQALTLANRGVVHDTDAGTMLIDPRTGQAKPIMNPTTGQAVGKPLKDIPPSVNSAIITNRQSLAQLDRALALVGGENIGDPAAGGMQGDTAATGLKGYLPQVALNRMDRSGVDTRAEIADIGSLKLHDRSGAAVTASESPRLMPFIPLATDDAPTVKKKLGRLRMELANETQALTDTYSKDQGYKPSPVKPLDVKAASPVAGNSVTTPDGKVHTFPNAAAAAQFKKAAGL